ncbi:MAG: T9SS type A sorting domain-containing protein, partial [Lewinella sp.]|nr:T9SS type A sorting domain-containing protein [Lewinella sp.]
SINPGATEICDGIDNNCDGNTDEGLDADADGIVDCFDPCPYFFDEPDNLATEYGLPCGWTIHEDHVGCNGSAGYNSETDTYHLTSADCEHNPYSSGPEAYALTFRELCGNGEFIARVSGIDGLGKGWAGIVMRESDSPDSKKFQLMTGLNYLLNRVDWRTTAGGTSQTQQFSRYGQFWLRIVRTGPIFQAFTSVNGVTWGVPISTQVIAMEDCLQVGLTVTNLPHATNLTASFNDVFLTGDGNEDLRPEPTSTAGSTDQQLTVYPNPTSGQLTLNLRGYLEQEATLEVYNAFGQLMQQRPLGVITAATETVDLSAAPAGVYLLRLRFEDGTRAQLQVVKQE